MSDDLPHIEYSRLGDVTGRVETVVGQADTAQTLGSGDVPVLATPRVLALAEAATVTALTRRMPTSATSVGTRVNLRHRAPTPLGRKVSAVAELVGHDGARLRFTVTVRDADGTVVADGEIDRVLVDRAAFLAKAQG